MSVPRQPSPAKLVISVLLQDKELVKIAGPLLAEQFGPVDLMSQWLPFDYTHYYENEMGAPLFRRLLAFRDWIDQTDLPEIKCKTNALEQQLAHPNGKRRLNMDPGYLLPERFVLATGKNYAHRIYLSKGIYADLTLIYRNKSFQTLPWTYPDYADKPVQNFLEWVRKKHCRDQKAQPSTVEEALFNPSQGVE